MLPEATGMARSRSPGGLLSPKDIHSAPFAAAKGSDCRASSFLLDIRSNNPIPSGRRSVKLWALTRHCVLSFARETSLRLRIRRVVERSNFLYWRRVSHTQIYRIQNGNPIFLNLFRSTNAFQCFLWKYL